MALTFWRHISVEPTMFLFMFAFMTTNVVEQEFFFQTACRVNHNFTAHVCANISAFPLQEKIVQITLAKFYQYEDITAQFFPIVLAIFLGEWSDKYGRKTPLIIGLLGKLYYSLMIVVNACAGWRLEYVLLTATVPASLTGTDMAIFASSFAYISDVTTIKNRTFRIGVLDAVYLCAMPFGIAVGSLLFTNVAKKSFAIMFGINSGFVAAAIIYSMLMLKSMVTEKQYINNTAGVTAYQKLVDFFSVDWSSLLVFFKWPNSRGVPAAESIATNARNTANTVNTAAAGNASTVTTAAVCTNNRLTASAANLIKRNRCHVILILMAMFFYAFQREEKSYMFLYTKAKFHWQVDDLSLFRIIRYSCYVFSLLILLPLGTLVFHMGDFTLAYIGCLAHIFAHLGFYIADSERTFVIAAILSGLGVLVGPILRSLASKLVVEDQRGKMFALLSVCENAVPIISTFAYSNIYRYTLNSNHSGVFMLTIATQIIVMTILGLILISNRSQKLRPVPESFCQVPERTIMWEQRHLAPHDFSIPDDGAPSTVSSANMQSQLPSKLRPRLSGHTRLSAIPFRPPGHLKPTDNTDQPMLSNLEVHYQPDHPHLRRSRERIPLQEYMNTMRRMPTPKPQLRTNPTEQRLLEASYSSVISSSYGGASPLASIASVASRASTAAVDSNFSYCDSDYFEDIYGFISMAAPNARRSTI